ncbi:sensor domain-containing diguanylate cyclase [Paenibacillus cymbidii]|uniref:sensor domain-containing diguanylate cyclase n=1 Tax=Paenibacillus cymbidii TaxID=1639034 RepID=UPI0010820DEE|nr:sensor domain-containing diguanylate cyclase [Paenibacillus cymbidii]
MTLSQVIVPLFTHFLPMIFFVFMLMDVIVRNRRSAEHRLAGGIILCCMLMFTEEYVRQMLPLSYSPMISVIWFSTAGITITGFGLHLFIKLAGLEHKMPRYLYPAFCYVPTFLVIVNLLVNDQMISGNEFHEAGIWKLPVYNEAYYIAMVGSNLFNLAYVMILSKGKKHAVSAEHGAIYNELILGVVVTAFFNLLIGLIDFKGWLPPYPYIYGGFAWCVLLRRTMLKYDFLNHIDKRYERLFNLNPAAIMLMDVHGNMKEANPSARQLCREMKLDYTRFFAILSEDVKRRIRAKEDIGNCEMTIDIGGKQVDVVLDGDYVLVDNQPHLILIVRDVTQEKKNQREVTFLAYHDPLTRLPNRRYFNESLNAAIEGAERHGHKLAVVLFDIDRFKELNDKYGHAVGDQALSHLASIVREAMPQGGMAARLGGDEFVLFLQPVASAQAVKELIQRLQRELETNKLIVDGEWIPIRLSIGASFYPGNGLDSDALLSSADKALYHVKQRGRNSFHMLPETS